MAQTVSLLLSAEHSADVQGIIEDRGRPVKHVQRAQIILLSAERLPVLEIAGAGDCQAGRHQPANGVALATALRRGRH
jgi:hypothetical protein